MKQIFLVILCLQVTCNAHSQGITLLYKGGGNANWNDPANWIQTNTPVGQTPIQRAPTELDDVVISSSQSGILAPNFGFSDSLVVGGNSTTGNRCKSMHVSSTDFGGAAVSSGGNPALINVYTTNGGFVLIDSGSNFRFGRFQLYGGNPAITDLEITNSTFGSLFSHADWSSIELSPNGKVKLSNTIYGGYRFGSQSTGGNIFVENCTFKLHSFLLGDNSSATILNSTIQDDLNNQGITFHVGKNANFVSSSVSIKSYCCIDFFTSGSVLNGNIGLLNSIGNLNFNQEDPLNPLPNIINGSIDLSGGIGIGIDGDVTISGNIINQGSVYPFPSITPVLINGQNIFKIGGIFNYGNTDSINDCANNFCHFKLEFFGSTNSNIVWPIGFPIDTFIVNKSGCAKVTAANSLYVSGAARIQSGQLVLDPNDTIPYQLVCAGDLNISQGGGIFLRKNAAGVAANIAVDGNIYDYNTVADSTCPGLSNPYNGVVTLYRKAAQNTGSNSVTIMSTGNIGNLNLIGENASDFALGGNLTVNNFSFLNAGKLLLGDHNLIVNGNISNYGPDNYFVTNGLGKLQLNNIGPVATVFPVGTSPASYTPATLTNVGTIDNFNMNVQPLVLSGGITGNKYISGVVNKTWNIEESIPGAGNVVLTLQWNAEDELAGFTRDNAWLSHYTSGAWNNGALMTANGANPYSLTRNNVTNFSPFAVMGTSGVVPVTLIDFNGKYTGKAIELKWSTETEINTNYFTLEKSFGQGLFKPLIDIRASGNTQGKKSYQHIDNTLLKPIDYYRLKMVNIDGSYTYSKTIAVAVPTDYAISIFPNPVTAELFIRLQDVSAETQINIFNAKGNLVRELKLKAGVTLTSINMFGLTAGAYSITFNSMNMKKVLKFIKQ